LSEVHAFLLLFNRRRVVVDQQVAVASALGRWFGLAVGKLYREHSQAISPLEQIDERRDQLRIAIRVADELLLACQHLLLAHWAQLSRPTPALYQSVAMDALRVMEVLRIMQRLSALHYQKLAQEHWTAANQLFFSLHGLQLSTVPLPALSCPGLVLCQEKRVTLEQVYLSVQFFGLLDATTWSLHDVDIPDAYLCALNPPLSLQVDGGSELAARQVIFYPELNSPPRFQRLPIAKRGLVLDLSVVFTLLEQHQQMLQRQLLVGDALQATPVPLVGLSLNGRLTVVDRMLYRLQPHRRMYERQPRQNVFLRLGHAGFNGCSAYLRQMVARPPGKMPAAGEPAPLDAWHLLDESLTGLRVTVREYPAMPPLVVGLCVLFERLNGCFETVGYIQRLHRLGEHAFELAIVKLGQQPQPVELQDPTRLDGQRWPGVLVLSPQGAWVLALPPGLGLQPGAPLWLWRDDGEKQMSRLGEQRLHNEDLVTYILHVMPLAGTPFLTTRPDVNRGRQGALTGVSGAN
jgi:hypothetical protein